MPAEIPALNLVVCLNRQYVLPCAVMLHSLFQHLSQPVPVTVFALSSEMTPQDVETMTRVTAPFGASFKLIAPSRLEWQHQVRYCGHVGVPAAYYRLLVGEELPTEITRVLYLDCDIVARHCILPLWNMPLGGHILRAVQHPTMHTLQSIYGEELCREAGVDEVTRYFNSGLLLIDLAAWRKHDVGQRALALAQRFRERLICHDQCPLNLAVAGQWHPLPPTWNAQTPVWMIPPEAAPYHHQEFKQARDDPAIVHYTFSDKPWHFGCRHPRTSFWWAAYYSSPLTWAGLSHSSGIRLWQADLTELLIRIRTMKNLRRSGVSLAVASKVCRRQMMLRPDLSAFAVAWIVYSKFAKLAKKVRVP